MKIFKVIFLCLLCFLMIIFAMILTNKNKISSQSSDYVSPEIKEDGIYFRYFNSKAKKVFLKSSFDEWSYRYAFYKKDDNVWELRLPTKDPLYHLKQGEYKYRLIIDGVNIYDNLNPNKEKDEFGIPLSILNVPYDIYDYSYSPINIKNNLYRFFAISVDTKTLEIVGSFNNFVPVEMKRDAHRPNLFYKDIVMSNGIYYYSFINDGKWEIDYKNASIVVDLTSKKLSKLIIGN